MKDDDAPGWPVSEDLEHAVHRIEVRAGRREHHVFDIPPHPLLDPAEELQREEADIDALARRAGLVVLGGLGLIGLAIFAAGMALGLAIGGGR